MSAYLEETILSVLNNLSAGDQSIVIDGGSTDGSVDIIKSYEKQLTGWVSEPDRGYADALAKGFTRATGDIFCWINAGDLLLPGALDSARKALDETGVDMIFGDDFYIDEDTRVISFSRGYVRDLRNAMLYGGWTPLQDACFWKRNLYEKVGGIDVGLTYAADYDLFLRMAIQGKCQYVPVAFSAFRRHHGQKSISGSDAYHSERTLVRHRELARWSEALPFNLLKMPWQWFFVRWRVYVMQRLWRGPTSSAGR
jgi:glycosyltransferase involved in cell wall biosynthesis